MAACERENVTPEALETVAKVAPPPLTEVHLPVMAVTPAFSHDAEFRGLMTMAVELGLSDLPGVIAVVSVDSLPPSFAVQRPVVRRQVDARLSARGAADSLTMELELCVAGGECRTTSAPATREAPWDGVAALLEGAALTLDVPVPETADWKKPGSKDSYSELITGRACAMFYGILPPPETPGDKKSDPVVKAIFLDPKQPLAQWVRARWEVGATGDGGLATEYLQRAALQRPWSPVLGADLATLYGASGRRAEAVLAWEDLVARDPTDARWMEAYAAALFAVGRTADARDALDRLPAEYEWDARVAALRVAVVEALGGEDLDPLLEKWQRVDSREVQPVRRRIDLRVRKGDYADARALVGALRQRSPGPAADALEVALLVALGQPEAAAELAPSDVGARLRARALREHDPGAMPEDLPADDVDARLQAAEAALWSGDAEVALRIANELSTADAFVLAARSSEALGRGDDASIAWSSAWDLDPGAEGGPVEADRVASTFRFVEQVDVVPVEGVVVGAKGPEL